MSLALAGSLAAGLAGEPIIATPVWLTANSTDDGDQDGPAIATNRAGHTAVVWEDDRDGNYGDNAHSDVYYRLFRHGADVCEVKLSAGGTSGKAWRHLTPDVGLDDKGNAVVVWADDPDGNGYFNISYRVLNTSCGVTASGRANSDTDGQQIRPRVAVDPDGSPGGGATAFTVVWEDITDSGVNTIKAAGFSGPATRAYAADATVSQTTEGHHDPDVAVSAAGDAWIVWASESGTDIALAHVSRTGTLIGAIGTANSNAQGQQTHPAIAVTYAGDFAIAWISDHSGVAGVWARSFKVDGSARHAEVPAAEGGLAPRIGVDEQGGVVLAWTVRATDLDVWVRGLNPDGTDTARLAAQRLGRATVGKQEQMVVAVSPYGEVSVAYTDDMDGNTSDQIVLGVGILNAAW